MHFHACVVQPCIPMLVLYSYTVPVHLSSMTCLIRLTLDGSRTTAFGGGIEHLPALRELVLWGRVRCANGTAVI